MSNRTTRGELAAQNLEKHVIDIYHRHGARLIEGHGSLATLQQSVNVTTTVPDDTVVILMSKPGVCMYSGSGRIIANEFFKTNTGLRTFFKGGGGTRLHHAANSQTRTFITGQKIPSVFITFKDEVYPSVGYVWKLPLTRRRAVHLNNMLQEPSPARSEVFTEIPHGGSYLLASVLRILGPGVYILNVCLAPGDITNNRFTGVNAPVKGWGGSKAAMASPEGRRYKDFMKPVRPPRPGSAGIKSTLLPMPNSQRVENASRIGGMNVREFLNAISKNPNLNFNTLAARLRANVNISRLRMVKNILKNSKSFYNSLSDNNKKLYILSRNKALFIHQKLLSNPNKYEGA